MNFRLGGRFGYVDYNGLDRTGIDKWEFRGKNLGKTWEKLGTFSNGFQGVTKNIGNFVGITWE